MNGPEWYANVVKRNVEVNSVNDGPMNENVETMSEEIKKKVLNKASGLLNLRVSALRKTRNVGIAIETVSERERSMIRECGKFKEMEFKVRCGETGHEMNVCRAQEECINCKEKKRVWNHSVVSKECPEYMSMLERARMCVCDECLKFLQLNCQRASAVMNDLGVMLCEKGISVVFLQEPYVAHGDIKGLSIHIRVWLKRVL
ncbi:hypothetical protein WH47_02409 [Habropoda laboriosa]|uniref:Uncharacterized protein n=1 Tax=Habropoda laboriosa TaxID=597456 RepID=A0A0L7QZ90_9HYME|nr:hypothetical protein WH47_02409 [Habropoda laboriosa]